MRTKLTILTCLLALGFGSFAGQVRADHATEPGWKLSGDEFVLERRALESLQRDEESIQQAQAQLNRRFAKLKAETAAIFSRLKGTCGVPETVPVTSLSYNPSTETLSVISSK